MQEEEPTKTSINDSTTSSFDGSSTFPPPPPQAKAIQHYHNPESDLVEYQTYLLGIKREISKTSEMSETGAEPDISLLPLKLETERRIETHGSPSPQTQPETSPPGSSGSRASVRRVTLDSQTSSITIPDVKQGDSEADFQGHGKNDYAMKGLSTKNDPEKEIERNNSHAIDLKQVEQGEENDRTNGEKDHAMSVPSIKSDPDEDIEQNQSHPVARIRSESPRSEDHSSRLGLSCEESKLLVEASKTVSYVIAKVCCSRFWSSFSNPD
jgi:hypothetical protein